MGTHNMPFFNMKKKNTQSYPKSAVMGFFSKGFKNEFERSAVNEPSVFEPLKFYCIWRKVALPMGQKKRFQHKHKKKKKKKKKN